MSSKSSKLRRTSQTKRHIIWNLQHKTISIICDLKMKCTASLVPMDAKSNQSCTGLLTVGQYRVLREFNCVIVQQGGKHESFDQLTQQQDSVNHNVIFLQHPEGCTFLAAQAAFRDNTNTFGTWTDRTGSDIMSVSTNILTNMTHSVGEADAWIGMSRSHEGLQCIEMSCVVTLSHQRNLEDLTVCKTGTH